VTVRRGRHFARPSWGQRLRAGLSLIGLVLVGGGSSLAWMATTVAQPASAATPPANSLPLHNDTAAPASGCPLGAYWHFVLTPNNGGSSFASIVLNLAGDPFTFTGFPPIITNGPQTDNVFVPVPAGHAVTDLEASGSYAIYSGATPSQFVLSGVCAGDPGATTTTQAPTTTTDPTTTTEATTSTTLATTTTQAPTTTTDPTTTTEATTSTTLATTTTQAPTTTPSACGLGGCVPPTTTPPSTAPNGCSGPAITCDPQPATHDPSTADPGTTAVSPTSVHPDAVEGTGSAASAPAALAFTGARVGLLVLAAAALIALGVVALTLGNQGRSPGHR